MAVLELAPAKPRRRVISLTPMIDVVFLILVFFMLASRFSTEQMIILNSAAPGAASSGYDGPPRLVNVTADGVQLNGVPVALSALPDQLWPLMPSEQSLVVLQPVAGATVQGITDAVDALNAGGIQRITVME